MYIDNVKHLPFYESLPEFYKELIRVWVQINKNKMTTNHDNFETVRKQIIWGNKNLQFNSKTLIFKNWIKDKILFVNDLVDENGVINENKILDKLTNKSNWISEISQLKAAIPNAWKNIFKFDNSKHSIVKTELKLHIKNSRGITLHLNNINNKQIYWCLIEQKIAKPLTHNFWKNELKFEDTWENIYKFIHKLFDNRFKQFRFKSLHQAIPSKVNLHIWKISTSNVCNVCLVNDSYQHQFKPL